MSEIETTSAASTDSGPDLNAIADRLFGKSSVPSTAADTSASAPAADPVAAQQARGTAISEQAAADKADAARKDSFDKHGLWKPPGEPPKAEVPESIRELRDTPERRMFSPQGTYASVQLEAALERVAIAPELKAAAAAEYREIFADLGASPQDAHELVTSASRFTAEPMTPERDAANTNDAIGALNREFGNDATSALKAAQQMVLRDPRLARVLDESRLGNDPAVVVKLAHLARSAKMRG